MYEFHIAKSIRDKFQLSASLFEFNGNIVLANFPLIRELAIKFNSDKPDSEKISPGELNAVGLIDEIYHYVLSVYEKQINPNALSRAYKYVSETVGNKAFEFFLIDFVRLFPPKHVYSGKLSPEEYLKKSFNGRAAREIVLEELLMLYLSNANPAANKMKELFDSNYITDKNTYSETIKLLKSFFEKEPRIGPDNLDVISFFEKPFKLHPNDLMKQLFYIKERWNLLLKDKFLNRILTGSDLFKEEFKLEGFGNAPSIVPQYKDTGNFSDAALGKSAFNFASESIKGYEEPEQFTPDVHWMPNVVLLAKNTYVWLHQLSEKYGRKIERLDQIPDEELDLIAQRNFNSIWLIGIWERSSASRKIKHLMGNIDAVASAYSLYDYVIAKDLGGEEAYANLDARCKARGIRLASDMVPNHTGIYSDWTINHPEYFIQKSESPFPNYSYTGENLSEDPNFEIRIEDGYYSRSDAAVVFEWKNLKTGETRYIYHGNDGTNMPWNDTAQLDMLKAEVREAVIQKIFDVARKFSIIRFDAAMTLAKKHFQRLWYPQPGTGGDIPSRSEKSMTREEFDRFFPNEFWREVVDRITAEMPETLLLAEAFWLMEGYFVRTLGMHRVYNSAFMHMMMNEENDKYRDLITNTLEFDPDILKRYVNFMSNPDEETAIKQFGTDDKYFGVCVLMCTLPGLPMFAHGQIEGFTEKYGMEYKRAYYDEQPNNWLIERHQKEIFPLLGKRYLFSEVKNFRFYNFTDASGHINENVFAFTNAFENEKVLVLYNNRYERAFGKIFRSTPKIVKSGSNKSSETVNIREALGIKLDPNYFYIAKELTSHNEYLFSGDEFADGLHLELDGFKYRVFYGFEEIYDDKGDLRKLKEQMGVKTAASIKQELTSVKLQPVHRAFEKLFDDDFIEEYVRTFVTAKDSKRAPKETTVLLEKKWKTLIEEIAKTENVILQNTTIDSIMDFSRALRLLNSFLEEEKFESRIKYSGLPKAVRISEDNNYYENTIILLLFFFIEELVRICGLGDFSELLKKLRLNSAIDSILKHLGRGKRGLYLENNLLRLLLSASDSLNRLSESKRPFEQIIPTTKKEFAKLLDTKYVTEFIAVNEYKNNIYYSKENYEEMLDWLFTISVLKDIYSNLKLRHIAGEELNSSVKHKRILEKIKYKYLLIEELKGLSGQCSYKFDKLKKILNGDDT